MSERNPLFLELFAEYDRQVKLGKERGDQYVKNLQAFAKEHPELAPIAQRLLSQHMGWV